MTANALVNKLAGIATVLAMVSLLLSGGTFAHAEEVAHQNVAVANGGFTHSHGSEERIRIKGGEIHCGANIMWQGSTALLGRPLGSAGTVAASSEIPSGACLFPDPPPPRFL